MEMKIIVMMMVMIMSDNIEIPAKKDMQTAYSYEERTQLRIFRGQRFNNSSVILAHTEWNEYTPSQVFDLAQQLYDEGIRRNWLKITEE